ncbi:vacuolar-processing enzyme beta-isozyme-like [Rutidosis leptorrhynchoides]|uniref:vacuolar-processing enzyme beta-isozyme-like n=1 Tax=Rutidosis leptorrhynchoides TaxID=125765 RepID=UPI003A9A471B
MAASHHLLFVLFLTLTLTLLVLQLSEASRSSFFSLRRSKLKGKKAQSFESMGVVDQRDADVYSMWHQYKSLTENSQEKEELLKKIKRITSHRAHLDNSIDIIRGKLLQGEIAVRPSGMAIVDDWDCLKTMVRTYETHCGSLTHYGMLHTLFADLCNNNISKEAMDEAAKATCSSYDMGQWDPAIVGYSA